MPIFGNTVDERFLEHRLRSTSLSSLAGGVLAGSLLLYRYYSRHVWSWELFAIIATMAAVKVGAMTWYRLTH